MKPLSSQLLALIQVAEGIVLRAQPLPQPNAAAFGELFYEIRRVHDLPAEHIRCTNGAMLMCHAIEGYRADEGANWLMLIGAALPLLRAEAWQALCNERATR